MHRPASAAPIRAASRSSVVPKSASQIEDSRPLSPNCATSSAVRTPGSAKLALAAVQACVTSGHGPVSLVLGAFQCTWYGVGGP